MSIHRLLWLTCISIVVRVSFELGRVYAIVLCFARVLLWFGGRHFRSNFGRLRSGVLLLCGCRVDSRLVTFGDCRVKLRC